MHTVFKWFLSFTLLISLSGCLSHTVQDGPPRQKLSLDQIQPAIPTAEPKSRYGNPASYVVNGREYVVLKTAKGYHRRGIASWYGRKFHGKLTSSREPYDMRAMTAASPVLPIPCYVRVTNLDNGKQVIVRVNDRGPFAANRIMDLSYAAALKLGYTNKGTAHVDVQAIDTSSQILPSTTKSPMDDDQNPGQSLYLQIGAFSNRNNARLLKNKTQRYIHLPIVTKSSNSTHPLTRVLIGPLKDTNQADRLFEKLQKHGIQHAVSILV